MWGASAPHPRILAGDATTARWPDRETSIGAGLLSAANMGRLRHHQAALGGMPRSSTTSCKFYIQVTTFTRFSYNTGFTVVWSRQTATAKLALRLMPYSRRRLRRSRGGSSTPFRRRKRNREVSLINQLGFLCADDPMSAGSAGSRRGSSANRNRAHRPPGDENQPLGGWLRFHSKSRCVASTRSKPGLGPSGQHPMSSGRVGYTRDRPVAKPG